MPGKSEIKYGFFVGIGFLLAFVLGSLIQAFLLRGARRVENG